MRGKPFLKKRFFPSNSPLPKTLERGRKTLVLAITKATSGSGYWQARGSADWERRLAAGLTSATRKSFRLRRCLLAGQKGALDGRHPGDVSDLRNADSPLERLILSIPESMRLNWIRQFHRRKAVSPVQKECRYGRRN